MTSSAASSFQSDTTEQLGLTVYSTPRDMPVRLPPKGGQCYTILRALQSGERLTVAKALSMFGVYALSQRCGELKRLGWPVKSRLITVQSGARVAEYSL